MNHVLFSALISALFLILNAAALLVVLTLNRREGARPAPPAAQPAEPRTLDAADILGWEFEYARITASEAMQDRHTMVNYYLLAAGILTSAAILAVGKESNLPAACGALLLWLLCGVGWFYFLKLIRLRQAWHGSAQAMNRIKEFYIAHARDFTPQELGAAFRWRAETLPRPGKPWTLFFYSAMLIGFLDSVAYVVGAALLSLEATLASPWLARLCLLPLGVAFFLFHGWLYFAFLRPDGPSAAR